MSDVMLSWGDFVFSLPTLAYQDFSRRNSWRWANNARMGVLDDAQFTGPGDDLVSLAGMLVPQVAGDRSSLSRLRAIGDEGKPRVLVGGDGVVFGPYVLTGLDERRSLLHGDGSARRYDFSIDLRRVPDDTMLDPDATNAVRVDANGFDIDPGDPQDVDPGDDV